MLVVTLTGGIASGKSTTARLLTSPKHALPLIDLDLLARQVVEPNDPSHSLNKLVAHFGDQILTPEGTLNRPALGKLAFGEGKEKDRAVLNRITHTAIRKRLLWLVTKHWITGTRILVIDTPLAVEAGLWRWCGEMVLVYCSWDAQLERMLKRDGPNGLTEEDARDRLSSQLPLDAKRPYANVVLDNDDGGASLEKQVDDLVLRWKNQTSRGIGWLLSTINWLVPPVGLIAAAFAIWGRTRRVQQQKRKDNKRTD